VGKKAAVNFLNPKIKEKGKFLSRTEDRKLGLGVYWRGGGGGTLILATEGKKKILCVEREIGDNSIPRVGRRKRGGIFLSHVPLKGGKRERGETYPFSRSRHYGRGGGGKPRNLHAASREGVKRKKLYFRETHLEDSRGSKRRSKVSRGGKRGESHVT